MKITFNWNQFSVLHHSYVNTRSSYKEGRQNVQTVRQEFFIIAIFHFYLNSDSGAQYFFKIPAMALDNKITKSSRSKQWSSWANGGYTCVHHKANSGVRVSHCAASQQQTLNPSAHLLLIRLLSAARESEKPPLYCQILLDIHYCLYIPH